jgi:hypothetical protein
MSYIRRVAAYLLVPVALLLLLPLLLLVVVVLYVGAVYQALRLLLLAMLGKRAPEERDVPRPHFLERKAPAP